MWKIGYWFHWGIAEIASLLMVSFCKFSKWRQILHKTRNGVTYFFSTEFKNVFFKQGVLFKITKLMLISPFLLYFHLTKHRTLYTCHLKYFYLGTRILPLCNYDNWSLLSKISSVKRAATLLQ